MSRWFSLLIALLLLAACAPRRNGALLQPMSHTFSEDGSGILKVKGQYVGWGPTTSTIVFSFDPDFPAPLRVGCVNAASTINAAVDRPLITFSAADAPFDEGSDGRNVISMGKSRRVYAENHAAETVTRISRTSPRLIEADIDLDTRRFKFGTQGHPREADVESTCLHELGHAVGLTHIMNRQSIMSPRLVLGTPKRDLSPGDRERLLKLYPAPVRQEAR